MVKFIKKNWLFLLFVIPFILVCINNKRPDNDIWFLLNNGRYVLEHGIPHIDPFTIHEGLNYVMQQWGASVIFFGMYKFLGKYGLLIIIYVITIAIMYAIYKLCYIVSNSKEKAIIIVTVASILIVDAIVLRPQIFTYLILILELLLLELYVKKDNSKYLYVLPFLSILLINLHASMWWFQFVFMLPFLLNTIKIKKITIDRVRLKPLIIVMILMFIGGFINPYGYEAITFIFKSYGLSTINKMVNEMKEPFFSRISFKIILSLILLLITVCVFSKKAKMDVRHFLFICGVTMLAFMHIKCYPYFIFVYAYCFAYLIKDIKFKLKIKNKYLLSFSRGIIMSCSVCLIISFVFVIYVLTTNYNFGSVYIGETSNYLVEHYDLDKIILFTDFDYGGYTEFLGIKSYIDGRAELFYKKSNGKDDILDEYYYLLYNDAKGDFKSFVDKYNFTHLIIDCYRNTNFDEYLATDDRYEVVYIEYFDENDKESEFRKIYALKNLRS
ncbi:MAG TPA: hypothetical protein DCE23_01550 [Firmicutes bacterium]|nr:hypothetical protein [Bacillota bacterium]